MQSNIGGLDGLEVVRTDWTSSEDPSVTDYLTDGVRLYEVIVSRAVHNHGLRGGTMRYAVVRDCSTEEERAITGDGLSACRRVNRHSSG